MIKNVTLFVLLSATGFLLYTPLVSADLLLVPSQYATINDAIIVSQNGDVIEIADGIYSGFGNYNLDFSGKAITVQSENGAENCIIQIDQNYTRGFIFRLSETTDSILKGLTIRDGNVELGSGGAISCINSSPMISECIFINNTAVFGGAIHLENSNAIVAHCRFFDNIADVEGPGFGAEGGGADCYSGGNPLFFNCLFDGNYAKSFGGGISLDTCDPTIINCTFVNNQCEIGAGVFFGGTGVDIWK